MPNKRFVIPKIVTKLPYHEVDKSNTIDLNDEERNKRELEEFMKEGEKAQELYNNSVKEMQNRIREIDK